MRPRFVVLASLLAALAVSAAPSVGGAAPRHNRGLTINATPNPILAGDSVLIYGQLNRPRINDETINLYQHVAGSDRGYNRIGQTTTDAHGFYSFSIPEDVVMTNRSWFTREAGSHGVHSRTVYERVSALVSIAASQTTQVTGQPIVFTGHVTPNHPFERVALQEQNGTGDDWHTLKTGFLNGGSNYAISYRWRLTAEHDVRVVLPGGTRNIKGESDPVAVTIQQKQVPGLTINTSAPEIDAGQPVTISGNDQSAPDATQLALFQRTPDQSKFTPVAFTTTGSGGSYSFGAQRPSSNTLYQVRTTSKPHGHSAVLFEGVRDVVTMTGPSTATEGQKVTFAGTVLPDNAGHVIYLQRLGKDGDWHVVQTRFVSGASTFQFAWRFGDEGMRAFRARITSDERNIGDASAPVTVKVTSAPTAALPPAS